MERVVDRASADDLRVATQALLLRVELLPEDVRGSFVEEAFAAVEKARRELPDYSDPDCEALATLVRASACDDGGIDPKQIAQLAHTHEKLVIVRELSPFTPLRRLLDVLGAEEAIVGEAVLTALRLYNDFTPEFDRDLVLDTATNLVHGKETDRGVRLAARDVIVALAEPGSELEYLGSDIRPQFGIRPYLSAGELSIATDMPNHLTLWYRTLGPQYMHIAAEPLFHTYPLVQLQAGRLPNSEHAVGLKWSMPAPLWNLLATPQLTSEGAALIERLNGSIASNERSDAAPPSGEPKKAKDAPQSLSPSQIRCLQTFLYTSGTIPEAAAASHLAEGTVKSHLNKINEFFNTGSNRSALISGIWEGVLVRDPKIADPKRIEFPLAPRELEALPFLISGIGGRIAAEKMDIEPTTFKCHVSRIYSKTELSITQLIRLGTWGRQLRVTPRSGFAPQLNKGDYDYLQGIIWAMPESQIQSHFGLSSDDIARSHGKLAEQFESDRKNRIGLAAVEAQVVKWSGCK